ncbi:TetR/AcrR family transcriptional regulator [Haloechinothrix sp. LS1_15]|nr:TetR/AcrR family transcriptional regulator [Haloechinothrix sp. LS1_15]
MLPRSWWTNRVSCGIADSRKVARRLLTAGVRCFASRGFHVTTTGHSTSAAGLSLAALDVHFGSKEEVLFEISQYVRDRRHSACDMASTLCAIVPVYDVRNCQ